MPTLRFLALLVAGCTVSLAAGCAGPSPGPPPPAPAEAGLNPRYEQAYTVLRTHPAVQTFAAAHLAPSEPLTIEVSAEVVPTDYALVAEDVATSTTATSFAAVQDSLTALAATDRFAPTTDAALPLLSMRQSRPLVLFFSRPADDRLAAQLYPNPYRRRSFEAIREDAPGLALLVVFDGDQVARVYTGAITP